MKTRNNGGKTLRHAYEFYHDSTLKPVAKNVYSFACSEFNKMISTEILNGLEFRMLHGMGYLSIRRFKRKINLNADGTMNKGKLKVDYAETIKLVIKKTGKTWTEAKAMIKNKEWTKYIYHFNDHTNGYTCRWYWDKWTSNMSNKTVYKFVPTKFNRLAIAKMIKTDKSIIDHYIEFKNRNIK